MAICHGCAGHPIARDVDLHLEDPEATGIDNNNESTCGSDTIVALGGLEKEGNTNKLLPSNQAKLTALSREMNELYQWVEAREGKQAESLDHIEWELQNLSLAFQPQPPPMSTSTEPLGEVICQYTNTLCTTQKQKNITNSLLQNITICNEYDSTKLEDWLVDIEIPVDLTSESWAKCAKEKLRGLTHTLVREAINSDKSWEEIKVTMTQTVQH